MNQSPGLLVYPRERVLGALTLIFGVLTWVLLIVGTLGIALGFVFLAFIAYVFAQSGFIAWIKGTAVKLSPEQHPDLYQRFGDCCRKLGMNEPPEAYIVEGGGMLNAFATRFFGRNFVVLLTDVIDALEDEPEGINFYMGHELGHIRMGHLTGRVWRLPVLWFPLLGAAYARAQEYTCDLHGRACCSSPQLASRALMVLAAGAQRWKTSNLASYARQAQENNGFWGSFHELVSGYPWLTKRVAYVQDPSAPAAGRNPLAYALALFVINGGSILGCMMTGVLVAIALPQYLDFQNRTVLAQAWTLGEPIREGLTAHYEQENDVPESLEAVGLPSTLSDGTPIELNTDDMSVQATTRIGTLVMQPRIMEDGLRWFCGSDDPKLDRQASHLDCYMNK
jgi:Zn-dependent protease with chaperone function